MQRTDVAIIGAGPAGVTAAVQCQRLGVTPLLLDRAGRAGGLIANAHRIENYPGLPAPVDGPTFALRLREQLTRFEVAVERETVCAVVPRVDGYEVIGERSIIAARVVIVAPGTRPRRLGIAGERELEGSRLFYEVRPLLERWPHPDRVSVVGGGEAACDYARSLAAAGASVELLVRGARLRARGRLAGAVVDHPAIAVRFGAALNDLRDQHGADQPILVAVGRRSAAPSLLEALGAAAPEACPRRGLLLAGDALHDGLGQMGIAVGEGLAAATEAVALLER